MHLISKPTLLTFYLSYYPSLLSRKVTISHYPYGKPLSTTDSFDFDPILQQCSFCRQGGYIVTCYKCSNVSGCYSYQGLIGCISWEHAISWMCPECHLSSNSFAPVCLCQLFMNLVHIHRRSNVSTQFHRDLWEDADLLFQWILWPFMAHL